MTRAAPVAPPRPDAGEDPGGPPPLGRGRVALEAAGLGALSVAIAVVLYRVWQRPFDRPLLSTGPDTSIIMTMLRSIQDHGWYLHNPSLNAPFGQQFFDFPHAGESLQLALIKLFTMVTPDAGSAMNLYYLTGFGLLCAVTYAVLRHLRLGARAAAVSSLLFTFLPYHFWHTEDHLYRSTYLTVPLAALVMLRVLAWRTTFLHHPDRPLDGWRSVRHRLRWPTVLSTAVLCVVVATFETMLIAFMLAGLSLCAVIVAVRRRDAGVLAATAGVIVVTGLAFALAMGPNLDYWWRNGSNPEVAKRSVTEQETFGLKISQLLLPVPEHRVHALGDITKEATRRSPLYSEGGQNLGLVGAAGLVVAVYGLVARGLRRRADGDVTDEGLLREHAGLACLVLILVSTVSGVALLASLAGFRQVRVWNRAAVLIGFFALLVVGLGVDRWLARARRWDGWKRPAATAAVVALAVFGLWDTAVPRGVRYGTPADIGDLRAFTGSLERALPRGASVFQLPYRQFPENDPLHDMRSLDEMLPYLWSDGLRWSAGGIHGRPDADWKRRVDEDDPTGSLAALRGLGFDAIEIDAYGYADHGRAVSRRLTAVLGDPIAVSPDGRWLAWDLRTWARRRGLTAGEAADAARELVGPELYAELPASVRAG